MPQKRNDDSPVTRSEFFKETGLIRKKINTLDGKFNTLDGKFNTLDGKFNTLDGKFNTLDGKFNTLDGKVNTLDGKFNKLDGKVNNIALELIKTQDDLREVKETMATKKDIDKVLSVLDTMTHRNEAYDRKVIFHGSRLNDHETRITHLEKAAH